MNNFFPPQTLKVISERLIEKEESIAVAESVTSGLLQYSFANTPGAAKFFQGGITAYNVGQKYKHLGVEPLHAQSVNCVSPKVAEQMAKNIAITFLSKWGVGITGYATAVEESDNTTFAYYAIVKNNTLVDSGKLTPDTNDPQQVHLFYVCEILEALAKLV